MMADTPPICAITLRNARLVEADGVRAEPLHLSDGRIASLASTHALRFDLADHLIFPGLINAHDHLQLNCIPPLPEAMAPGENPQISQISQINNAQASRPQHPTPGVPKSLWGAQRLTPEHRVFPNSYAWMEAFQAYRADPAVAAACAIPTTMRHWHGALKNLLCGATTVAHHDPVYPMLWEPAFPVRVLRDFGWSHSLGLSAPSTAYSRLRYGPEVRESFSVTPAAQPWIIHLAEGTDAVAEAELTVLDSLGCLAANTLLVHGVGLTEGDIERVAMRGAGVIWCPGSNLMLLGHTLSPRRLVNAGLLALGSDSRLAGSFDLLAELRLAANCSDCSPAELLALATTAASRLLRLPDVGGLASGQHADLIIVRNRGHDPYLALLKLHRADIRAVVRNGKPAIADPDFADWFAACGIQTVSLRLDGRPKLCAEDLLGPPGVIELEPGIELGV
jgi:hypothetical protein